MSARRSACLSMVTELSNRVVGFSSKSFSIDLSTGVQLFSKVLWRFRCTKAANKCRTFNNGEGFHTQSLGEVQAESSSELELFRGTVPQDNLGTSRSHTLRSPGTNVCIVKSIPVISVTGMLRSLPTLLLPSSFRCHWSRTRRPPLYFEQLISFLSRVLQKEAGGHVMKCVP